MKKRHLSVMHGVLLVLLLTGLLFSCIDTVTSSSDTAPGIPTDVSLIPGDTLVTASWTAPEDTGLIDGNNTLGIITKYTVYWGDNANIDTSSSSKLETEGTTLVIPDLVNKTQYYFIVTAHNATGESLPTTAIQATPTDDPVALNGINLSYTDIAASTGAGNGNTSSPSWAVTHSEIDYTIAPENESITIDEAGVVTVDTTTAIASAQYTVSATAKSSSTLYSGSQTATLTIEISVAVTGVVIDQGGTVRVDFGQTTQLTATVSPNDATDSSVTWGSSNETGATIDSNGLVTGRAGGDVTITVTTTDGGHQATITLTVQVNLNTATLNYTGVSTGFGQTGSSGNPSWTGGVGAPTNPAYAITVASIDGPQTDGVTANVVSINTSTGVVTIADTAEVVHSGSYLVTATADGADPKYISSTKRTATLAVTVNPMSVIGLSGYANIDAVFNTAIANQNPTVTPNGATGSYKITPTLPTGLSLDTGTGRLSGTPSVGSASETYTITFTANGNYTGTPTQGITIAVTVPATGVSIDGGNTGATVGTNKTLAAFVEPATATDQRVTWSSSDTDVATIDNAGVITPKTAGSTMITVTTTDGSHQNSITLTVSLATVSVSGVSIDQGNTADVNVQDTTKLTVTVSPNDATDSSVTWESNDEAVATIDSTGLVTGVAGGDVTITVRTTDGNYTDTLTLTVARVNLNTATLSYTDVSTGYGQTGSSGTPSWTGGVGIPTNPAYAIAAASTDRPQTDGVGANVVSINPSTGEVTTTAAAEVVHSGSYVVTATANGADPHYAAGSQQTATLVVTVNPISVTGLSGYTSTIDAVFNAAIATQTPTITPNGATGAYAITPTLPTGLSFNTTGVLSGTPTELLGSTMYRVTFNANGNYTGTVEDTFTLTVSAASVTELSDYTDISVIVDTAITTQTPTVTPNGATGSYEITPALPAGLTLDTDTGELSGTPSVVSDSTLYTVTFNANGKYTGKVTDTFDLTVSAISVTGLSDYTDITAVFNTAIAEQSPSVTPSGATGSYEITPTLPTGLTLDTATGTLSGTPSVLSDLATYTVTFNANGKYTGKVTDTFNLTVSVASVTELSDYTNITAVFNTAIAEQSPSVTPSGATGTYAIEPTLPTGLSLDTDTGELSGTPSVLMTSDTYTITFNANGNYAGEVKATFNLTVNRATLSGTLTFANKAVTELTGGTHSGTVTLAGLTAGTDYELSISPPVTGMTIDNNGVITIPNSIATNHAGQYTVTATGKGNYTGEVTDTFTLTVNTVISVSIAGEATRTAALDDAGVQLTATVTMSDGSTSNEVTWLSSAEGVAVVSDVGVVTFVAVGNVVITATSTINTTRTATVSFLVVAQNTLNLDFVEVKGGSFQMGSPEDEENRNTDEVLHTVTVSDFYMSKYEITFDQYDVYVAAINDEDTVPSPSDEDWGTGIRPVIDVSWYDAVRFFNWLSKEDGLTPVYTISGMDVTADFDANGYRLPTEAEWEYAARGGEKSQGYLYSGSDTVGDVSWYSGNSDWKTHPVGGKLPNELGLYDMSGNVYEWCWDWYGEDYYGVSPQTNPAGPASGSRRVSRGGSWYFDGRSANRNSISPSYRYSDLGLRLVWRP